MEEINIKTEKEKTTFNTYHPLTQDQSVLGSADESFVPWNLLLVFTLFAIIGMFVGIALSRRISGEKLKPVFGWFVLLMGVFILFNELYFKS